MLMAKGTWVLGAAMLLFGATGAWASIPIDIAVSPAFPDYVVNPGGTITADCTIYSPRVELGQIRVTILGPQGFKVVRETYPGTATLRHQWTVPEGMPNGWYRYVVSFTSPTGEDGTGEARFFVMVPSTGICAFKVIDNNANGEWDEGIDEHGVGWQMCVEPGLGCLYTASTYGEACWFFIQPGTYEVCETLQPGYYPVVPTCQTVEVSFQEIVEVDFYNTPTGACCFHPGGDCLELTEEECSARGGMFVGDFSTCSPGLCPPSATEPSTWGRVKEIYR